MIWPDYYFVESFILFLIIIVSYLSLMSNLYKTACTF